MMETFEQDSTGMFASPDVALKRRADGAIVLHSRHLLAEYPRCTGEYLEAWAERVPTRRFLVERAPDGAWRHVSYAQTLEQVRRVGTFLLRQKLSAERPVMVLSGNSIEHAVLALACLHVGIPIAPVSPAYSLLSKDFLKLEKIVAALRPGLIYAADPKRFGAALAALRGRHDATTVVSRDCTATNGAVSFAVLAAGLDSEAVQHAFASVSPDTIAKFLFTSGSTDEPKAVVNTQRMLCSNQEAIARLWPFLEEPPVLLDWLPWHHTFGGNHNFNLTLRNGGTLYIDRGRPLPDEFGITLANLREVAPTIAFNVPRAYDLLVGELQRDELLRRRFFSRLRLIFYAAAALPQPVWDALKALSMQELGHELPMVSSWGLTETAPAATSCHYRAERAGVVGLPLPGCEIKLVPTSDKLEARVRGPNVTPGYWKRPDLTAACFDEEGFFRTGDAMRFVDPERPEGGLCFDGRLGEDFKLSTGTWVRVGTLRLAAIAALAPVAQDAVVAGHDRDEIALLVVPNLRACRSLAGLPAEADPRQVLESTAVRARVAAGLFAMAELGGGSSTRATRALLLTEPLCIDAGEITDKGYVNQRAVLAQRADLVNTLYRTPLDARVVTPLASELCLAPSIKEEGSDTTTPERARR